MDIGHRKSGLYSVMGKKQIETVYCDFTKQPNGAGKKNCRFYCFQVLLKKRCRLNRFSEMDWLRGREINTNLLLRPEKYRILHDEYSDSLRN
jgi:hypothetical protein